jgi:beta-1,4-mannosyl-glycoprotein beta-1,4-N-acetylglucosaminyltransferase
MQPSLVSAKIYDCFIFFNKLEILEIRLNELYDHVDKFVIVECPKTFRGKSKPLYFTNNKERFKAFQDKIIHVVIPSSGSSDPWLSEAYQRNGIALALKECESDDIILVSDADEFICPAAIPLIQEKLLKDRVLAVKCAQKYYRYYLNALDNTNLHEADTVATTYRYLCTTSPNTFRWDRRNVKLNFPVIPNAGWHFPSIGGIERYAYKLESFSHAECDLPENKRPEYIFNYVKNNCTLVPIDNSFPKLIQEREEYYRSIGFIVFE